MRMYFYIHFFLLVCIPTHLASAERSAFRDPVQNVLNYAMALRPSADFFFVQLLSAELVKWCRSEDWKDALHIAYVETRLRPLSSHTRDHGPLQVNEMHGSFKGQSLSAHVQLACHLLYKAKQEGAVCRYHNRRPSICRAYANRLEKAAMRAH